MVFNNERRPRHFIRCPYFFIFAVLIISTMLLFVDAQPAESVDLVVFSDDFDDGVIDSSKWIVSGDGITEANGVLSIFRNSADDSIRTVNSFTGYFEVELRIKLEQISWQDMFHGISLSDSKGNSISFGFCQYGQFYLSNYRGASGSYNYTSSFRLNTWYQWKLVLESWGEQIYIYVDGEQVFSTSMAHPTGNIFISLPGDYQDGNGGLGTKSNTDYITVTYPETIMPKAQFSADKTSIPVGATVTFTDLSIGFPTSWLWNFGDGQTITSQNPSHTYTTTGSYTVTLTVTNPSGSDTETKIDYITVQITEGYIQWSQTYGGTGFEEAYAVIQTVDGGFALAGFTTSFGAGNQDAWLVKTDARGGVEWTQTYGGSDDERAFAVIQTVDGGFALAGWTESSGAGRADFWLVKTDARGTMEWQHTYGGSAAEYARSVIQTADGGFILTGYTISSGVKEGWVVKIDARGAVDWNQTFGRDFGDAKFEDGIQTADGSFVFAGSTKNSGVNMIVGWLVKIDARGELQWQQTYGGAGIEVAKAVIQTVDGGFALAGCTWPTGEDIEKFWLLKTDACGEPQWKRTYGGAQPDEAKSVIQTADGGFALAGYTWSTGAGNDDVWLVKTDICGELQWTRTFGGSYNDAAFAAIETADGGFALAGYTGSYGVGNGDFWLVKTIPPEPKPPEPTMETDTDGDGLLDTEEVTKYGTNPCVPDAEADIDGDGLTNVAEVDRYRTNPTVADTDQDGLEDGTEVLTYETDPLDMDSDGDDLTDGEEVTTYGTNPTVADTDGDGLIDGEEVLTYETDPLVADTDEDTYSDGAEVSARTNPLDPAEHPSTTPGTTTDTATTDTPAAFIPGFTLVELVLALACLVVLAQRKTKQ